MRKSSDTRNKYFNGHHRQEHWYRDNTVYFLTTRCTNKFLAFASPEAQAIFWRQYEKYTKEHHFDTWICTLMHNHYHAVGYLPTGNDLAPLVQKLHGSVAKLVNDLLPQRLTPFWTEYFDGCLRDETQYRRAYRYTMLQSVRHGICRDWRDYKNTRIYRGPDEGLQLALSRRAFLPMVPYKRYHHGD